MYLREVRPSKGGSGVPSYRRNLSGDNAEGKINAPNTSVARGCIEHPAKRVSISKKEQSVADSGPNITQFQRNVRAPSGAHDGAIIVA